jgi:EpsI family protein
MQWLSGDDRSLSTALDLDTTGLGTQLARVRDIRPSFALLGSSGVLAAVGLAGLLFPAPALPPVERDPFALFPTRMGDWAEINRQTLTEQIERALGADDYIAAQFLSPDARGPVDVFIAWYQDQTNGGIHSPEVCIPGSGWEMATIDQITIHIESDGIVRNMPVNRAIIQKGVQRQLVYYWFDQRGRRLTSDYAAKAFLLWDAVQTGRTDGALLRLITNIYPGETEAAAEVRLKSALAEMAPLLPRFIDTE